MLVYASQFPFPDTRHRFMERQEHSTIISPFASIHVDCLLHAGIVDVIVSLSRIVHVTGGTLHPVQLTTRSPVYGSGLVM